MKRYRFILPIVSILLVLSIFAMSLFALYGSTGSFRVSFSNPDGLFGDIAVRLEVYDDYDNYSLVADVAAGESAAPKFKYNDRYRDHYSYSNNYDNYFRGESKITAGYSFELPDGAEMTAEEGGGSYTSSVTYPDGRVVTETFTEPYYKVDMVYVCRSLYIGETLFGQKIYETEPMLLEAGEDLEIFVGGGSYGEPYTPSYIELCTEKDRKIRISGISKANWFWSDADENVFFIDCLEEIYCKKSAIHHLKSTGEGDLEYQKIADIDFGNNVKILDYRVYENTSLLVVEDEDGVKQILTCDHETGESRTIASYENEAVENVQINYSNGAACVRFASSAYWVEGSRYTLSIDYFAIELSSHTLCAHGSVKNLAIENVYGNAFCQNENDTMDILRQDGKLYVIDLALMQTASPTDISAIPIISVMDKNGPILMGYRFLSANFPENGGQMIITKFVK